MGAFDGILGNLMGLMGTPQAGAPQAGAGQPSQGAGPLIASALQLLQQNGGLQGLLAKFQQAGLTQQAQSWVSTGANLPISADQLQKVLGSGALGQIASKLGISHGEAGSQLAGLLPNLIDKMTPQGQVPDNHHDLISEGLAMLSGKSARA